MLFIYGMQVLNETIKCKYCKNPIEGSEEGDCHKSCQRLVKDFETKGLELLSESLSFKIEIIQNIVHFFYNGYHLNSCNCFNINNMNKLSLTNFNLMYIPSNFDNIKNLVELDISFNAINYIPRNIVMMKLLK